MAEFLEQVEINVELRGSEQPTLRLRLDGPPTAPGTESAIDIPLSALSQDAAAYLSVRVEEFINQSIAAVRKDNVLQEPYTEPEHCSVASCRHGAERENPTCDRHFALFNAWLKRLRLDRGTYEDFVEDSLLSLYANTAHTLTVTREIMPTDKAAVWTDEYDNLRKMYPAALEWAVSIENGGTIWEAHTKQVYLTLRPALRPGEPMELWAWGLRPDGTIWTVGPDWTTRFEHAVEYHEEGCL